MDQARPQAAATRQQQSTAQGHPTLEVFTLSNTKIKPGFVRASACTTLQAERCVVWQCAQSMCKAALHQPGRMCNRFSNGPGTNKVNCIAEEERGSHRQAEMAHVHCCQCLGLPRMRVGY